MLPHSVESHCVETNLSCNKLSGYFEPGGNKGGGGPSVSTAVSFENFDELPALPDLTMPFLGGIDLPAVQREGRERMNAD
jgi:hypothetical protein